MKSKRAFLMEPGKFEIKEVDVQIAADEVLVKVSSCGLCNWELNHWKGLLGQCPQTLGHEWAGVVVETGKDVKNIAKGDYVTGLFTGIGFTEYTAAKASQCFKLDKSIDPKYALAEPVKCVTTVISAACPMPGDIGVIIGAGPMGIWCMQALSGNMLGGLVAVDIDDNKLSLAKKYGATHTINPKKDNVANKLSDITNGRLADFVIEGTGVPEMVDAAMDYIRNTGRGRLIIMSSYERDTSKMDLRKAVNKSLEIRVAHPGYSFDNADDMRRAVMLINKGTYKFKELITHEFSLDNIQQAFETLENKPQGYLKGIVVP